MSRNRTLEASYLKTGTTTEGQNTVDVFSLMGTGFTSLNEEPSAKVGTKKYINDVSASNSIKGYEWKTPFEAEQIKSDTAVKYIMDVGKEQKTGADAETDYIVVDLDEPGSTTNTYAARKFRVAIEVATFTEDDGDMGMTGNLLGVGDPIVGTFNTTTNTFTAGS